MRYPISRTIAALAILPVIVIGGVLRSRSVDAAAPEAPSSPRYDSAFWDHWGDGRAELAAYDLVQPRYGELRHGTAVAIFVTEDFLESERVKAERPLPGRFPVLKLNLVQDFPTGIYDYNLMTSTFVALSSVQGRPAGTPTKVSFTAQEWCGHVYQHLLFDRGSGRSVLHSYFQDEADKEAVLESPRDATSQDALLLWARGLAYPVVPAGESLEVPAVTSLATARLRHREVTTDLLRLARSETTRRLEVPAGSFEVRDAVARVGARAGETTWRFAVEADPPHRIVAWEVSSGEKAELLGADRLAYWELNASGDESYLERIGLGPRPPRTP